MIAFVYGTTAELIKLAPVFHRLVEDGARPALWCTGQQIEELVGAHDRLGLPEPDVWLASGTRGRSLTRPADVPRWLAAVARTARRRRRELIRALWSDGAPPIVLVHGDTMTTVVGAVLGRWLGATVGHIEAGLRSGDLLSPFPEELDRRLTAVLAHVHYAPGAGNVVNLRRVRGTKVDTIHNTVIDSLRLVPPGTPSGLGPLPERYGLVSLHRFELVRNGERLREAFEVLAAHSRTVPLYAVTDPLVSAALREEGLEHLFDGVHLVRVPKLPYFEFVALLRGAAFVVTDSGGLQEECAHLDIPCLVHRLTTERSDGIGGNAVLSGFDVDVLRAFLDAPERLRGRAVPDETSPSVVIAEHLRREGYLPVRQVASGPRPAVSVIVPAYREVETIRSSITVLLRQLERDGLDFEVIVVSDGNRDGTQHEAAQVASDRVRVLHYADNAGKGFAIRYGLAQARGDLVAFYDADLTIAPSGIARLAHQLEAHDVDVVVGAKAHPASEVAMPWSRRLQMRLFSAFVRRAFDLPVDDTQTGLKVFRRPVLDRVVPYTRTNGFAFDIEVLASAHELGATIEEGPVEIHGRLGPIVRPSVLVGVAAGALRLAVLRRQLSRDRAASASGGPQGGSTAEVAAASPAPADGRGTAGPSPMP